MPSRLESAGPACRQPRGQPRHAEHAPPPTPPTPPTPDSPLSLQTHCHDGFARVLGLIQPVPPGGAAAVCSSQRAAVLLAPVEPPHTTDSLPCCSPAWPSCAPAPHGICCRSLPAGVSPAYGSPCQNSPSVSQAGRQAGKKAHIASRIINQLAWYGTLTCALRTVLLGGMMH